MTHKILVIDEIDSFSSNEKSFLTFVKAIIKNNANTSLLGIANSVDLPFKKHSALSLRDVQLLFKPYDLVQLTTIMEEKIFSNYPKVKNLQLNDLFLSLIDDKALEIISRKVAKMSGDVRVAFDIMKSCLNRLWH